VYMDTGDMVYYRDAENNICSGGYMINNAFMKAGIPAVFSNAAQVGGGDPLRDLAIPAGLVFLQRIAVDKHHGMRLFPDALAEGDHKVLDDNLYSKLINLVKVSKSSKGTRKKRVKRSKKRKTRRK